MAALSRKLRSAEGSVLVFWCPGCDEPHGVTIREGSWTWNGDAERPTFSPSVLVRSGHFIPDHAGSCWCTYNAEHPDAPAPFVCRTCHSFVVDGRIQFLGDCTHTLVAQTVDLPDWTE
jgi:hypothetical protein